MEDLEKIKELIGRNLDISVPSIKNVNSALEETEEVLKNIKQIKGALRELKKAGVSSVIMIDYENKKIKIYGKHFLTLAKKGYEISIKREKRDIEGSLEMGSIKVVGNMDRELAKEVYQEQNQFEFHKSELKAKNLEEFKETLEKAPLPSIRYHYQRGDFRRWLGRTLKRGDLTKKIDDLEEDLEDKKLKKKLLEIVK